MYRPPSSSDFGPWTLGFGLRPILLWLSAFQLFSVLAFSADVIYTNSAATNRPILLTPLQLTPPFGTSPLYDRISGHTDTNGYYCLSNATPGLWMAAVSSPPDRTVFSILVPTNSGQVWMDQILVATPRTVNRPQDYPYSAAASDARYVPHGPLTIDGLAAVKLTDGLGNTNAITLLSPQAFNFDTGATFNGVVHASNFVSSGSQSKLAPSPKSRVVSDEIINASSVIFWGAAGDGSTDDTAAIQATINAATNGLHGNAWWVAGNMAREVVIPAGTYRVTGPLYVPTGVSIRGAGAMNTLLLNGTTNSTFVYARVYPMGILPAMTIEGLSISYDLSYPTNAIAIDIDGGSTDQFPSEVAPTLRNLLIVRADIGIRMQWVINPHVEDVRVTGCRSHGIQFVGPINAGTMANSWACLNGGNGWDLTACYYTTFSGCAADGNGQNGYQINNFWTSSFLSCGAEQNAQSGFYLTNSRNVSLVSPFVEGGVGLHGITIDSRCTNINLLQPFLFAITATGYGLNLTNQGGTWPTGVRLLDGWFGDNVLGFWGSGNINHANTLLELNDSNSQTLNQDLTLNRSLNLTNKVFISTTNNWPLDVNAFWARFHNEGTAYQILELGVNTKSMQIGLADNAGLNFGNELLQSGFISVANPQSFQLAVGNYARLTVTTNGYVGIGTTNPAATLHVNGTLRVDQSTNSTGTSVVGQLPITVNGVIYYLDLKK